MKILLAVFLALVTSACVAPYVSHPDSAAAQGSRSGDETRAHRPSGRIMVCTEYPAYKCSPGYKK